MNYLNVRCKRCGYNLTVPEKTESVVCGSCGYENKLKGVMSLIKTSSDQVTIELPDIKPSEKNKKDYREMYKDSIKTPLPIKEGKVPSQAKEDEVEDNEVFPENTSVSKILTLLFILMPIIAMLADFFNLPSFILPVVIFIIVLAIFMMKKKN